MAVIALLAFGFGTAQATQDSSLTGSGNWTIPAGVSSVQVWMWGGGGGGGGVKSTALNAGAGGGGGGAFTTNLLTGLTPGNVIAYSVGAAGAGGASGGGNGGDGGDTSFVGCTTAAKGLGGGGVTVSSTPGSGGAGGTVTGTGNYNGGSGATGTTTASGGGGGSAGSAGYGDNGGVTTPPTSGGTAGAGTPGGGTGAAGRTTASSGATPGAAQQGAGGSGALNLATGGNRAGGAGIAGKITLTYSATYYSQGSLDTTLTTSWNTSRGGGGSAPANFTTGDTFVIQNGHSMTVASAWTISGTGLDVKLQIENGGTLTATALITVPTFQVDNGGSYVHNAVSGVANGNANDIPGTTRSFGASSTVEIQKWANNGTAPVALPAVNWGNLTINVASLGGNWVQSADITVNGNFVVQATGGTTREFQLNNTTSARTVTVGGNLSVSGGILNLSTSTGSTTVNVSGDVSASGGTLKATTATYGKINFAKTGTQSFTSGGTINNIDWTVNSGATVAAGTSVFSGSGVTFTLNSGGGFSTTSASGINGNFSVITPTLNTGGNYTFAGSGASAVTGSQLPGTVNNLTINNANGVSLSGNTTVNGALTLTSGQLVPGANTFTLASAATISGAGGSSYVRGSLVRTFASGSGQSFTAPVGTSGSYRPATIDALDVGTGGTLTFSTTDGDHADIANSGIMNNKSANAVWTVVPGGGFVLGTSGYSLDLTWASGDLDGSATAGSFVMKKYSGATWSSPAGVTAAATHTLGTGFTAFSDFIVGEAGASASASSDIIRDSGFTEPSNVAYGDYQTASGLTTGNSIELAKFIIQDGGGSADADALTTELSAITFNAANGGNLRRVALFDGSTLIAEIAGGTTLAFTSLSGLTASDDGSKSFSLRATFNSSVTDNQQLQFTVTSATAGSGSQFASGNAGGAASSIAGDANRIEVTATKLAFSSVPANATQNVNFAATVQAQDVNNNVDLDDTTSVSLSRGSGTGTLSGGDAQSLVSGARTFSNLNHDTVETITLTASGGSLTSATSANISVLPPAPVAVNDTATTIVNVPIMINVTTNDANFAVPIASVTPVTWAASTVVVTNGTNVFYTPALGSNGTDHFQYVITNAYSQAATGTVTVTVTIPAVHTWDGEGGDDKWSTGANWDFDAAPAFPVALAFDGSTRPAPSNDYSSATVSSITFNATAGAFTLGGNDITLAGNITNNSTSAQTINMPINLGSSTRNIKGGAGGITLGGSLSGTGGITLPTSAGTLTLSGNNTNYAGTITLATGTRLNINHNDALGTGALQANNQPEIDNTSGSPVTITNTVTPGGNTLTFIGTTNLTINSTYTLPANRTLNVNGSTLTIKNIDAASTTYTLSKGGGGTLAITDAAGATFQGGFTLIAGTLLLGHKSAVDGGPLSMNGGTLQASTDLSGGNAITNAIKGNNTAVSFSGANNMTFSGAFGIAGAKTLTNNLDSGRILVFSGSVTNSNTGSVTMTLAGWGDTMFSGAIENGAASAVSLTINNSGVTTFSGTNTYSGTTIVNGGTLRVTGQAGTASGTGPGAVNVNAGGTLGGDGRVVGVITVADASTAMLYPHGNFVGATLTCGSNVTFAGSNAQAKFDLTADSVSPDNDRVVLEDKMLTCNGATVVINSAGTLAAADYTLFDVGVSGSISGNFAATPLWTGTVPANSNYYTITKDTRYVYIHYIVPPTSVDDSAETTLGSPITIKVTTNDSNFAGTIAGVLNTLTWPGTTLIVTNGTNVFYTPASGSNGTDRFQYVITNAVGQSATGLVSVSVTPPGSRIWDGEGDDDKWSTGGNWDYNVAPAFPVALVFDGPTRLTPSNDYAGVTVSGMTFNAAAGAFTIGGNSITLSGNIDSTAPSGGGARTQTINLNMDIGASTRTISAKGDATHYHNITLAGIISGSGGLTKANVSGANSAVVTLSGLNTFEGKMTTAGSALSINSIANSGLPCAIGKNSLINLAGTLVYTGVPAGTDRQIEVAGTSVIKNDGGALTFANATFNVPVGTTTNTLTLGGAGAGTNEIQGVIQNQGSPGLINISLGASSVPGNTWRFSGANTYAGITTIQNGGVLEAAILANGGANSGIGASDNAAANLVFNEGTLRYVGGANAATDRGFTVSGNGGTATIECSGGGTLRFDNTVAIAYGTADQSKEIVLGGSNTGSNTFGKVIADNGTGGVGVNKTGSGRWILAGNNAYSGYTTLSGGALEVGGLTGGSLSANSYLRLGGGVLQANGSFIRAAGASSGTTFQWLSSNGGGFSARNGKLTVTVGNNAASELSWKDAADVTAIWGPLLFGSASANAETEFQNKINLLSVTGTTNRTVDVAAGEGGDFATLSGVIRNSQGTAGLVKTGAGTLRLTAANTYNGGTIVSNGTLLVDNATGSGTGTGAVNIEGGTLGGTGRVAGVISIADANTAMLYPRGNFAGATFTCGSNVTFAGSNARAKFDLGASTVAGNDKVVLDNKTLTCNGATVVINSTGTLSREDYILFDVGASGSIVGNFAKTPVWAGTAPANAGEYKIVKDARYLYLRYADEGSVYTIR